MPVASRRARTTISDIAIASAGHAGIRQLGARLRVMKRDVPSATKARSRVRTDGQIDPTPTTNLACLSGAAQEVACMERVHRPLARKRARTRNGPRAIGIGLDFSAGLPPLITAPAVSCPVRDRARMGGARSDRGDAGEPGRWHRLPLARGRGEDEEEDRSEVADDRGHRPLNVTRRFRQRVRVASGSAPPSRRPC